MRYIRVARNKLFKKEKRSSDTGGVRLCIICPRIMQLEYATGCACLYPEPEVRKIPECTNLDSKFIGTVSPDLYKFRVLNRYPLNCLYPVFKLSQLFQSVFTWVLSRGILQWVFCSFAAL